MIDTVSMIIQYEQGELDAEDVVKLFAELIKSGLAWSLQGHYGREASRLIDAGIISRGGEINWYVYDTYAYD